MADKSEDRIFGAYNGIPIRCKLLNTELLINVTDLKKASEATDKHRCDRWRASDNIQNHLADKARELNIKPIRNKKGLISEVPGVLEVISGGNRFFQGTYASCELAKLYTQEISVDCYQWLDEQLLDQKTNDVVKAKKVSILLGHIRIDVYEIPTGEYRLSQTQVTEVVGKEEFSFRDFLDSKSPEALPYKGIRFGKMKVDGNNVRPKAIPIPVAAAFWTKESIKGNEIASRLLGACAVESIKRRADKAFGKNITDKEYNQHFEQNYKNIIASCPKPLIETGAGKSTLKVAVFEGDSRKIKKLYPNGIIPGFSTKESIMERLILLSSYDECSPWKLIPGRELFRSNQTKIAKCPDFVSNVIEINEKKAVFIFQIYPGIIGSSDVEQCIAKRYAYIAKKQYKVDYSFLFLVSPIGASPSARSVIEDELEIAEVNIGILTIKQLSEFYYGLISGVKSGAQTMRKANKYFKPFLEYKIYSPLQQATQLCIEFLTAS